METRQQKICIRVKGTFLSMLHVMNESVIFSVTYTQGFFFINPGRNPEPDTEFYS